LISFVEKDFVETNALLEEDDANKATLLDRIKLACHEQDI
jgi:hypothetical protein